MLKTNIWRDKTAMLLGHFAAGTDMLGFVFFVCRCCTVFMPNPRLEGGRQESLGEARIRTERGPSGALGGFLKSWSGILCIWLVCGVSRKGGGQAGEAPEGLVVPSCC